MSDEKTIQHARKAVDIVLNKSLPLKEKIRGLIEEVLIIVFAVTITLALHNWNDERHEKEIARNFLIGVKSDLKLNALRLAESIRDFQPTIDYYDNVWKQIKINKIDSLYDDSLSGSLLNTMYFAFDNSRFEGFKSSGYLRLIENEQLLKHLVWLYSVQMPFQKEADVDVFANRQRDYTQYIGSKAKLDTAGNIHISKLLNSPAIQYQIYRYTWIFKERKLHKQELLAQMKALSADIDKELNK